MMEMFQTSLIAKETVLVLLMDGAVQEVHQLRQKPVPQYAEMDLK